MAGFFIMLALSTLTLSVTSLITYEILRIMWSLLPRLNIRPRLRVLLILVPIFFAHIVGIWIYAGVYLLVEHYTNLGHLTGSVAASDLTYESYIERLYFSASTYASLGLGDVAPIGHLRMLAAAEVLNGLVLIGWTVSFTYLTMEKFWSQTHRRNHSSS